MNNIYVNCGGILDVYKSKKEVMDFFEDCILMSEGDERERYNEIYFSVKENLYTNKRCFSDGTDFIYTSNINWNEISQDDELLLIDNFNVSKTDLLRFKAINYLSKNNKRINQSTLDRYESDVELITNYISNREERSFYYINKSNMIVCISSSDSLLDHYYKEEFPLEDYEYANEWLDGELEYSVYLEMKKQNIEMEVTI